MIVFRFSFLIMLAMLLGVTYLWGIPGLVVFAFVFLLLKR